MATATELVHQVEFSESEIAQILGTAVKQMVSIANLPHVEQEIKTLGTVIEKCSKFTPKRRKTKA